MNARLSIVLLLAASCLSLGGCGGCSSSNNSLAAMRRRAMVGNPDSEPDDLPAAEAPAPPAAAPPPAANQPAPATPQPAPATTQPANSKPIPTAPAIRSSQPAAPEIYPSDLIPKVPTEPLPEVGPVKVVVAPRSGEVLSPLDRRARAIDHLKRIGLALNQYVAKHGALPPQAIRNDRGEATLSWRVAILPELGYEELFRQFRLFEPWDSKHNQQLLAQIPPELAAPERPDTATNYVAIVAPDAAFGGERGAAPKSFEDGPENTIIVVEADDLQAVPWTKPADLTVGTSPVRQGLGSLRGDGFLALLADGRVKRVPPELPELVLRSLLTTDSGEPLLAADLLKEPTLEPVAVAAAPPTDIVAELVASAPKATAPKPSAVIGPAAASDALLGRLPIPDEATLAKSKQLLRELWGKQVQAARSPEERSRMAGALLVEAAKVEANSADYYVLVQIARDMAAGVGDANTAIKASDLLVNKFQLQPLATNLKLLTDLAKVVRAPQTAGMLAIKSRNLLQFAYDSDDYASAATAYDLFADYTKLTGDQGAIKAVQQLRPIVEGARQAYAVIPEMLKRLEADPNDAEANEAVGKYLCLVKSQWDAGLPLLVRGGDVKYRIVATIDLEPVRSATDTLALADQYWDMADSHRQPFKRGLHLRAVYWYQIAATQLAGSLEKIRAQKRLDEAVAMYGKEDIQRSLGLAPTTPSGGPIAVPGTVGVPVPSGRPRGVPVPGTSGG